MGRDYREPLGKNTKSAKNAKSNDAKAKPAAQKAPKKDNSEGRGTRSSNRTAIDLSTAKYAISAFSANKDLCLLPVPLKTIPGALMSYVPLHREMSRIGGKLAGVSRWGFICGRGRDKWGRTARNIGAWCAVLLDFFQQTTVAGPNTVSSHDSTSPCWSLDALVAGRDRWRSGIGAPKRGAGRGKQRGTQYGRPRRYRRAEADRGSRRTAAGGGSSDGGQPALKRHVGRADDTNGGRGRHLGRIGRRQWAAIDPRWLGPAAGSGGLGGGKGRSDTGCGAVNGRKEQW
ncbi:hypothetical protein B0H13DRAFT_1857458 [Mycena leptocephala]|nr:hypothetical protein B0H13DRAFT_1857458 [Mycena leptocephala]